MTGVKRETAGYFTDSGCARLRSLSPIRLDILTGYNECSVFFDSLRLGTAIWTTFFYLPWCLYASVSYLLMTSLANGPSISSSRCRSSHNQCNCRMKWSFKLESRNFTCLPTWRNARSTTPSTSSQEWGEPMVRGLSVVGLKLIQSPQAQKKWVLGLTTIP